MTDIDHSKDDDGEQYDFNIRVPGVAYDVGQKGFARVFVMARLADSAKEYDRRRPDDKSILDYFKNRLVGADDSDAVYQCVFLPDSPATRDGLKDPSTRYPLPESRLIPFRAEQGDPIDDSERWTPRQFVEYDLLHALFSISHHHEDAPDAEAVHTMAQYAGLDPEVVDAASDDSHAVFAEGDTMNVGDAGLTTELVDDEDDE